MLKPLADRIEEGKINLCCLQEANLFNAEWEAGHKLVRVCRVCHSRHVRMKAQPGKIFATQHRPNFINQVGPFRHYKMGAESGRMGASRGFPS